MWCAEVRAQLCAVGVIKPGERIDGRALKPKKPRKRKQTDEEPMTFEKWNALALPEDQQPVPASVHSQLLRE